MGKYRGETMKYAEIIKKMSLTEKASLMSGANYWNTEKIDRLSVPSIMMTDGPHGLRKQGGKADHLGLHKSLPATCFPTAATLANSWDKELIREIGEKLGKEAASENVNVLLGPGLNIKRNPLCGRNFEYFSEDPYLSGVLATEMVKGIESNGVGACPKHFAVNSQEHMRMTVDEVVDERSLRELYLEGFRRVIEETKPKTIMTSYNKLNGTYTNEHPELLTEILYDEWGFDGVVITDWGGNNDRIAALKEGNQLEMPSTNGLTDFEIVLAVENDELDEAILDKAVDDMLDLIYTTQLDGEELPEVNELEHHLKAIDAAQRSIVLLKNEDNVLPIREEQRIAVIGDFAKYPRYQGSGSSLINPTKLSNALNVFNNDEDISVIGYEPGFKRRGGKSEKLLKNAVSLARQADTVLLFLGLDELSESEGLDRENLSLKDNQLELVDALLKENTKIVVIISGGGPVEMPFADDVHGIIHAYLAGQGSGEALNNIVKGNYNPSGKLSETFPISYDDVSSAPYFPGKEATAEHREGIFIGYRYFDKVNKPVLFPFGYGISYTTFDYEELTVGDNHVTFKITNTGDVAGEEVAQLYIEKVGTKIFRAKKELKGFEKVALEPGESKTVTISLEERDFAYYNTSVKDWVVEPGEYNILIGSSSRHIHLQDTLEKIGVEAECEHTKENFPQYFSGKVHEVSDEEYVRLLGYEPPDPLWDREKPLNINDSFAQLQYKNRFGRFLYGSILFLRKFFLFIRKPFVSNNVYYLLNMRFIHLERMTGGKIKRKRVDKLLEWANRLPKKST